MLGAENIRASLGSQPVQPDVTATAARAPRPHTRLLSGIRKEKIYIDMVVLIFFFMMIDYIIFLTAVLQYSIRISSDAVL